MISVLYVDDWSSLLSIICRFLERKGDVEVETVLSTKDALRIFDYIPFDVIVTDYNSKESHGISLLQKTRQKGNMTPFVFFTLEQDSCLEKEAKRYGRVAFLPKICNSGSGFEELEKAIRTVVQRPYSENIKQSIGLVSPSEGRSY